MERLRSIYTSAALLLALTLTSACTRSVDGDLQLQLEIPTSLSSKVSALSTHKLVHVIINMRVNPLAPPVPHYPNLSGTGENESVTVLVPGFKVPRSKTLLVQYLGVYEAPGQGMIMKYGSTTVDSDVSGPIPARIVATNQASSALFGNVSGRYMPGGVAGPTGFVRSSYFPPNLEPPMLIETSYMYDGWFQVIALDGVFLKHEVDGNPVFGGPVDLNSFQPGTKIAKVHVPAGLRVDKDGNRPESESVLVYGLFGNGSGTLAANSVPQSIASGRACYKSSESQIIPELLNAAGSAPLAFKGASGTVADARPLAGGVNCVTPTSTDLFVNPDWLSHNRDAIGINGPFAALNYKRDFDSSPHYLSARAEDSGGNPEVHLKWKYLAGVNGVAKVEGVTVFSRKGHYPGPWGDDEELVACDVRALEMGYRSHVHVPSGESQIITTDSYGTPLSYTQGDQEYVHDQNFLICPYRTVASVKKYYPHMAMAHCSGGPCNDKHKGLKIPSPATVISGAEDTASLGGSSRKVTAAAFDGDNLKLTAATHGILVGEEVLVRIVGKTGANACGTYLGQELDGARFHFARTVEGTGGTFIYIPKGSWADGLTTAGAPLMAAVGSPAWCAVRVSRVFHYGDLDINASISLRPFDYDTSNEDGLLAIRSTGKITFSSSGFISGVRLGYQSGPADGDGFDPSNYFGNGQQGTGGSSGGGGGSVASGGAGGGVLAGIGGSPFASMTDGPIMGGAGGGNGTNFGGEGGGSVYIVANEIENNNSGIVINVSGFDGNSGSSSSGGGGAGGSVYIYAEKTSGAQQLLVQADGGSGGSSTGTGGGGGGAGVVSIYSCHQGPAAAPIYSSVGGNPGGGPTPGVPGGNHSFSTVGPAQSCQ